MIQRISRDQFDILGSNMFGERLDGRPVQGIREQSATQNYKIGSRRIEKNWVLHYARATVAIPSVTGKYRLAGALTPILAANELIMTVVAAAGQRYVTIPDATSVVNYYANGTIECWPSVAGTFEFHRIISSTVSNGTTVTLTLDDNLDNALAIGDMVAPMPSPYVATGPMGAAYAGRQQAIGLPLIPVTINYYYWAITWGEVFLSCQGGGWPEDTQSCMDVFAWQDGTVAHLGAWGAGTYDGAGTSPQRVGNALYSGDYGTGRIMLQLDP
jgi:hypothetical protein